ncbi:RNA-directed DNA polymerase [Camponotus japonicus]
MFVAAINDDCILGLDFLKRINLENIFDHEFKESSKDLKFNQNQIYNCSRIENFPEVPIILKELLKNNSINLKETEKEIFADFLNNYQDIFTENIVAGNCNVVEHVINVKDSLPFKQAPRRIPIHLRKEVDQIIEDMKRQGVIEESQSPWTSPAVLVKKKDGSIRFCIDYRKLNNMTVKDSYPLPRIDDLLDQLSGNSWFSTLDLKNGYWQLKVRSEDKEKTAFSIGRGLWQFTVMPFGLCNAPATFERLMEKVLHGLLSKKCLVYLDDVIIFGKTFDEMMENLNIVFSRLKEANLKMNPKKCTFFQKNVKYLGHIISNKGVTTDPEKIIAVRDWPIPHTRKQLRSFLGFCSYYRRFVKGFSSVAKPLYVLTENQVKFVWEKECQHAFEKLKSILSSAPVLSFPRGEDEFILDTDASNIGIGAVLSQRQSGKERVIAYFSKVLSKTERNYCVTRRELLAVVDSLKFFRHYLLGRKFIIRTDHISLKWLMSFKDLEGQLARWLERLQEFEFDIIHRKGQSHGNADGLSRRLCETFGCEYCAKVERKNAEGTEKRVARIVFAREDLEEWRQAQQRDPSISFLLQGRETGRRPLHSEIPTRNISAQIYWSYWDSLVLKEGILYKRWEAPNLRTSFLQLIVPQERTKEILREAHDSPSGGHFGVNKTLAKIRKRFFWANCKQDVEKWCRTCRICVSKKGPFGKGKSPLQLYNVEAPLDRIQMDILGPFPLTKAGNKYLLVMVDCFTKWVEAFPIKNIRAKTVAEAFVSQFVSRHGVPLEIHTDQGKNFESQLFIELMQLLGIKKTRTTALHPQSDGQVERQHQTIINYLAKYISENQRDWDEWVPMFLLAYRSSKHETTGMTPAELYFARELRLPIDLLQGTPRLEDRLPPETFVENLREKLEEIHSDVRERMALKSSQMKTRYDRKVRTILFEEGERVWFYNPRRSKGKAPKLQSNWEGPYFIVKKFNDVIYCIQKTPRHRKKVVHADRLAPFLERD